jgi:hypothetical protein
MLTYYFLFFSVSEQKYIVRLGALTAVVMKSYVFWNIMPYSPLKLNRRFGGICHLHFQGRRIKEIRIQHEASNKLPCSIEDGGQMFLRNVCWRPTDYTTLYPGRYKASEILWVVVKKERLTNYIKVNTLAFAIVWLALYTVLN